MSSELKALSTSVLTALRNDIVSRLEDLSSFLERHRGGDSSSSSCSSPLAAEDPAVLATLNAVVGKALTKPDSLPQPGVYAMRTLSLLASTLHLPASTSVENNVVEQLSKVVQSFLDVALRVLWEFSEECPMLVAPVEQLLWCLYRWENPSIQRAVMEALETSLQHYLSAAIAKASSRDPGPPLPHTTVSVVLRVLLPMYKGLRAPLHYTRVDAMVRYLTPLCRANMSGTVSDSPAFDLYGSTVVQAIRVQCAKLDPDEASHVTSRIFRSVLPGMQDGKLMGSIATVTAVGLLLDELDGDSFEDVQGDILDMCTKACRSDFPPVLVKGMNLWRQDGFLSLCTRCAPTAALAAMTGPLFQEGKVHWDAGCRAAIFDTWSWMDQTFRRAADEHSGGETGLMTLELYNSVVDGGEEAVERYRGELKRAVENDRVQQAKLEAEKEHRKGYHVVARAAEGISRHLHLVFGKTVGNGAFGVVKYAKQIDGTVLPSLWHEYAVKEISKALVAEQGCNEDVQREIELHRQATRATEGKYVVPLYQVFEDAKKLYLLSGFMQQGDLFDLCSSIEEKQTGLADSSATTSERFAYTQSFLGYQAWLVSALRSAAEGLSVLHRNDIFFGDVKPENCLVQPNGLLLLCDFGAAQRLSTIGTLHRFSGTLEYCAPEIIAVLTSGTHNSSLDGAAADAWSFGCLCAQLICGRLPFEGTTLEEMTDAHHRGLDETLRSLLPEAVVGLLDPHPSTRWTLPRAMEAPFFASSSSVGKGPVTLPPSIVGTDMCATRHSGRRESMMWKRANIAAVRTKQAVSSTMILNEAEGEGPLTIRYEAKNVFAGSGATGVRKMSEGLGTPGSVSQYYTVMPRR